MCTNWRGGLCTWLEIWTVYRRLYHKYFYIINFKYYSRLIFVHNKLNKRNAGQAQSISQIVSSLHTYTVSQKNIVLINLELHKIGRLPSKVISIEVYLSSKVVSFEGPLQSKGVFSWRLYSIKGKRSFSVKGRLPSKVVFHQRSPSVKGCLLSKVVFRQRSSSVIPS